MGEPLLTKMAPPMSDDFPRNEQFVSSGELPRVMQTAPPKWAGEPRSVELPMTWTPSKRRTAS